jgi:hypothetical protein
MTAVFPCPTRTALDAAAESTLRDFGDLAMRGADAIASSWAAAHALYIATGIERCATMAENLRALVEIFVAIELLAKDPIPVDAEVAERLAEFADALVAPLPTAIDLPPAGEALTFERGVAVGVAKGKLLGVALAAKVRRGGGR